MKFRLSIIFLFLLFLPAFAQNIPPGEEPSAQTERFLKDLERKKALKEKETKPVQMEFKEEEKPALEKVKFVLKEVIIKGATVFKNEEFYPLYEPYLNKEITFAELDSIVEKIKEKYRKNGYLAVSVYLPEQQIQEGKVEIRVVEAKRGKLDIEGNRWFPSSWIERFFHTKKNEILNFKKIQRDILRLNRNPDLEVKVIVSAGKEPETSDIILKVKEKFPYHIGIGFDNHGTRLTGRLRSSTYFSSTNLSGRGDMLFFNSLFTSSSFGESINYNFPIGTYGTKGGIEFTYFKMKLGKEFKSSDITGRTQIYNPYLKWELYISEDFQADLQNGLKIKSTRKKIATQLTTEEELRIFYFDFDFTLEDALGKTVFSPRFNFSTEHLLGASARNNPSASRAGSGGFFFKYEQVLSRIQRMPFDSYINVRTQFQNASHTLPSSEQMQLGGINSVRGYPEGDFLCDMGASLNFEWFLPFYFIPANWSLPGSEVSLRRQIEQLFFLDVGAGKNKKVLSGEERSKFLLGIGAGLRFRFFDNFYLRLEWAEHLGDRPQHGSGPSTFYLTFQLEK